MAHSKNKSYQTNIEQPAYKEPIGYKLGMKLMEEFQKNITTENLMRNIDVQEYKQDINYHGKDLKVNHRYLTIGTNEIAEDLRPSEEQKEDDESSSSD